MIHLADSTASTNPLLPSWPEFIIGTILFVLVFGFLAKLLLPRIQQTLAERTEQIEGGLARSEEAQAEAQQLLDQYRQQLAEARHEAARLREEAREQGAQIIAEMREQAQAEARRVTEAAQAQIQAERQQALTSLRAEVGTLATELASRIVGESLTDRRGRAGWWTGSSTSSSRCPARDGTPAVLGLPPRSVRQKSPKYARKAMSMRGVSRASFAELSERLSAEHITSATVATRLANELFAVVGLLDTEHGLRRALSDPGKPAAEKGAVVGALLHGKITAARRGAGRGGRRSPLGEHAATWRTRSSSSRSRPWCWPPRRTTASMTWRTGCSGSAGWSRPTGPAGRAGRSVAARAGQAGAARHPARGQGDRGDARPDQPDGGAPARAVADRRPGPVRRHRGAAPAAADRGGAHGGRAVREPAQAARRRRWPAPTGTMFTWMSSSIPRSWVEFPSRSGMSL